MDTDAEERRRAGNAAGGRKGGRNRWSPESRAAEAVRLLTDPAIAEAARKVVADWPPPTAEQCAKLRALGLIVNRLADGTAKR